MGHEISRRTLLRSTSGIVAATAIGGTLTACSGGTGAGSTSSELTMTWWGSDDRHNAYKKALATFQKDNPKIKIRETYSGYDGYFDKFNTNIAGGSAPDLLQMDTALVAQYARKGVLAPLDSYVGKSLDLTGFSKTLLAAGTVDGKLYGVPSGIGVNQLTVNRSGLEDLGLKLPDREWTWADLKKIAQDVYKKSGGKIYGVDDGGGSTLQCFEIFAREKGETFFSEDGKKLGFTSDTLQEWWEYWAEMRKTNASGPPAITSAAHNDLTKNAVVIGKALFTFDSGVYGAGGSITDAQLDFLPTPQGDWSGAREGNFVNGGVLLSATKASKKVADSVKIMAFFAQNETAIKDMQLLRGIPPTEKARNLIASGLTETDKLNMENADYIAKRVAAASNALPAPQPPPQGADQIWDLLFQSNLAIAFGKKSIKAQLGEFFDQAAGILGG
ncbi:extracellular solute-binding protein [Streptomyces ipomoeae]|uniref:Extracellular solute-binding protein n=1 Tax=Streptomyces ipomoeae TaxID=103232 RepID=A0A540Q005_9ACTN|nr:extracellular solute-binding protein [Streptomyces ipomoeae]MDX2695678.1 extracellular solute-binding protein [Streptomyces ipomoeae]MDX2822731.1 extracellular solute-binding protein [Streptomyces ipomoeae]MDX2840985.1 extracellular solute-binding protein [Streptomyces ipomoeae]MDX2876664.1 extracellular solute-binding protein [Streptomyces ipomoeae]MDX2933898.1 extracellular solute-binding protein [Streptomyces ipomoeae]